MKNANKQKKLLITGVLVLAVFLAGLLIYDHIHYDRSKDNIFEIPETYNLWEGANVMFYEKYYFIQYPPKSQQEMKDMIRDHVERNEVLKDARNNNADCVELHFMAADLRLPIYFKENKSYFEMDDFISHYVKTNRIALYMYDFETEAEKIEI